MRKATGRLCRLLRTKPICGWPPKLAAGLLVRTVAERLGPLVAGEVATSHGAGVRDGLIDARVPAVGASVVSRDGQNIAALGEARGDGNWLGSGGCGDSAEKIEGVRVPEGDGAVRGPRHNAGAVW